MTKKKRFRAGRTGRVGGKRWKFDFDYKEIDKLSDKDKEFYLSFLEEYYLTNFKHQGKKLHKTKEEKLELYGLNNAANRCIMGLSESKTIQTDLDFTTISGVEDYESYLIKLLDEGDESVE